MSPKTFLLYFLIFSILGITCVLWFFSKNGPLSFSTAGLQLTSQLLALIGLVCISLTLVLSTKMNFIEKILHGLDKAFYLHRILGSLGFLFILHHPLLLAIQALPHTQSAMMYLLPGKMLSYNLGIFSLYIMLFSFIFIVFIKLPYHIWKLTHQLLSLAFLLGSIHALLITSDMSTFLPLRIWMGIFISIGIFSSFYSIFLYRYLGEQYIYVVKNIFQKNTILDIYLEPIKHILHHEPGQFVFTSFLKNLPGGEHHPFSISSPPESSQIRLSVKVVGDYTSKLPFLQIGDRVKLYGPYGAFAKSIKDNRPILCIAGGIGITPLLSIIQNETTNKSTREIVLYYLTKNSLEAVYNDELLMLASQNPYLKIVNWYSSELGRISIDKIENAIGSLSEYHILLCGPSKMMDEISKQAIKSGVKEENIVFEDFAFI